VEFGVLVAARVPALSSCTLRAFEPLFPVPKSAMVVRYRLQGHDKTLAVANLHAVNFTLGLGRFGEQIEAVAQELAAHDGPVVFAGDFNTWSQPRLELLLGVTRRLALEAVQPAPDGRIRALGMHLDHVFVRGLKVERATAPVVSSSDHNPILLVLALR
jgi:endonuclease/exonuclease/phosphatase (EEP) superfamily protein YafD